MKATITFLTALFTAVVLCCIFSTKAFGQQVTREGNNFTQVATVHQSSDVQTVYTYTVKDISYPIWITKNGRCYIVRISKNGNQYKQYLSKDICLQICKELNITYVETQQ